MISGGSLIKTGSGTLTLTGANTYDHTALRRGTLLVNNTTGSGTGGIRVRVFGGILGGTGYINGKTTIDGTLGGAWLSPGVDGPGTLRFGQYLIIGSLATFSCELDTVTHEVERFPPSRWLLAPLQCSISLFWVTRFCRRHSLHGHRRSGKRSLPTVQRGSGIHGNFGNLPDGGTITAGSNTFQANYEGGDGNDLTLTVVQ